MNTPLGPGEPQGIVDRLEATLVDLDPVGTVDVEASGEEEILEVLGSPEPPD